VERRLQLVGVFGSADPPEGDPLFELARRVGQLLVTAGYGVVTGGYGGVMEGASRGAAEHGGGAVGITCAAFSNRAPNRFLTSPRGADSSVETGRSSRPPAVTSCSTGSRALSRS
jgi:uncharacterized protein (TIGR00725 family)